MSDNPCRLTFLSFKNLLTYFLLAWCFTLIQACPPSRQNKWEARCTAENFDANCCPKPDLAVRGLPPPHVSQVNVIIETSGSMAGYMPRKGDATDFQKIIPEVLSALDEDYPKKVTFYSIFDSRSPLKKLEISDARDKILRGDFAWSGNTYLPQMLDSVIVDHLKNGAINIFISDCIYDPAEQDAKSTALAMTDIRDEIKKYAAGNATDFVSLYSVFTHRKIAVSKSPYYMILQGPPENVNAIRTNLITSFNRYHQQYNEEVFGFPGRIPPFSILPYTQISPNCRAVSSPSYDGAFVSIQDIQPSSPNPDITFWLGLDLKNLPAFARDPSYIRKYLEVTAENGGAVKLDVLNNTPPGIAHDDQTLADRYSHFIRISVKNLTEPVSGLKLSLQYVRPDWIADQNENDRLRKDLHDKTFGLNNIATGLEQAYNQDSTNYFFKNLPLSLIFN